MLWSLIFLGCIIATSAQVTDMEYQEWAAKHFRDKMPDPENNPQDKESMEKGRSMACGICNVMIKTVSERHKAGQDGKLKNGFKEADAIKILDAMCEHIAPRMAKEMDLNGNDAKMVCRRLTKENAQDLLDLVSVGEDSDLFCKDEVQVCDFGHKEMVCTPS